MTDEGKKDTEAWIELKGAKYAYGYDKGGKLKGQMGVGGIPHALLVDPSGKIVWEGHPGNLQAGEIEKALSGALLKPMWEWPAASKDVKSALSKHKYADALAAAGKLSEADMGPTIKAAVQSMVTGRVAGVKFALDAGDFLTASESAAALESDLAGLPELAEIKSAEDAIKSNKDAAKIIKAQKVVQDLKSQRLGKKKEMEKAIADLQKIAKDLPGTVAEKEANALIAVLQKPKK